MEPMFWKVQHYKMFGYHQAFALNGWSDRKYNYFKMTDNPQERSSIELEFKVNDQFLAYGVAFSKGGLLEEWLYKTGSRNDTMIFERKRSGNDWENVIAPQFLKDENGQFLKYLIDGTPTKGTVPKVSILNVTEKVSMLSSWRESGSRI